MHFTGSLCLIDFQCQAYSESQSWHTLYMTLTVGMSAFQASWHGLLLLECNDPSHSMHAKAKITSELAFDELIIIADTDITSQIHEAVLS